ncbi:hypothetical protein RSOL_204920, partial [Rhizoctonia solani AG-3 Rhs1AP]
MASEPIAVDKTVIAPMVNSMDVIDSQYGRSTRHRGQSSWSMCALAGDQSPTIGERNAARAASLHDQRCVLTGNRDCVKRFHLLPKSMTSEEVQNLQYSFGRKLDLNSRRFLLCLDSNFHHKFETNARGWALIPVPSIIVSIAQKMRAETERRLQLDIKGPWPDYRQRDWFPITRAGFAFQLIPLGLAHPASDPIYRCMDLDNPNAHTRAHQRFDPPSFAGFPTLNLLVHPYVMILNAYPKLERHLQTQELPPPANTNFDDLKFIYDILTKSAEQIRLSTAFKLSTQQ